MREIDKLMSDTNGLIWVLENKLDAMLDVYAADSGLTLPRFNSRHITFGMGALQGRPVSPQTIWVRMGAVHNRHQSHRSIQMGFRDLEVAVFVRVFMPVVQSNPELTERVAAIYSEAIFRVMEHHLKAGNAHGVYWDNYEPAPSPITEEASKGLTREIELMFRVDFRTDRHNLIA
jgi:hypothetical protein